MARIDDGAFRRIHQFGLQRTGTNATKALIEANFLDVKVLTTTLGSKHYLPRDSLLAQPDMSYVVNIKDPITWMVAYWRYKAWQASEESPPRVYDELPFQLPEWLHVWAERHEAWLTLADQMPERTVVIQHERLLRNPAGCLIEIVDHLALTRRPGRLCLFLRGYARRGSETDRGVTLIDRRTRFDRTRHLDGRWADGIAEEALKEARVFFETWQAEHPVWAARFDTRHLDYIDQWREGLA